MKPYRFAIYCNRKTVPPSPRKHCQVKETSMKTTSLTLPELALIAGTRVMLGGGLALLLADRLTRDQRKTVGSTLFIAGAITTIPLGILALSRRR
jgi:hypothetical protein